VVAHERGGARPGAQARHYSQLKSVYVELGDVACPYPSAGS